MKRYFLTFATVLLLGMAGSANAQQAPEQPREIEPGVGRISFIHGDISTQRGDAGELTAGTLNTPIVSGDRILTGMRSRAEVQLDYSNILRMSDNSTANIVNLTRTQIQIQVAQGLMTYDVLKGNEADIEIDTPNVAIHPQLGEGSYRITVNSDGETIVDVHDGSAEISTPQGSTHVVKNDRITIQGTDNPQYQVSRAPGKDDWDKWNEDRDHVIESAESWHHTDRYYTGSQDLDAYGRWQSVPDYGYVWFPAVSPGWAPYRDGRWVWEPYYGWTWVSYEPWGWAPYHYGRWFIYGGSWCWWPGPVYGYGAGLYRPIWAPAYVSFFGFGSGGRFSWGVGVGFGSVGWLPIGPADPFFPWYGRGVTRVNVVNITNVYNGRNYDRRYAPLYSGRNGFSNINRVFTDDHIRRGLSSMPSGEFGRARVPSEQRSLSAASIRQAGFVTGRMPMNPTRESYQSTDRAVNAANFSNRSREPQRFFSKSGWTSAPQNLRGQQGGTGPRAGQSTVRPSPAQNRSVPAPSRQDRQPPATNQRQPNAERPGWRNFGSRNPGNAAPAPGPAQNRSVPAPSRQDRQAPATNQRQPNAERPGWHNFGSRNPGNATPAPGPAQNRSVPAPSRQDRQAPATNQRQPNAARPGWQNFGSGNSGNRGSGPAQTDRPARVNTQGQRSFNGPASRESPPSQAARPGWSRFTPSSRSSGPDFASGNSERGGGQVFSPPAYSSRQSQPSPRGNSNAREYSRPPLEMRQPIVTPRANRSYSYPRSAPGGGFRGGQSSGGGYSAGRSSGGSSRGGYSGGGNSGGSRGGGSRGGNSAGRASSGRRGR
jgi:Family of unknown function (DUF6600)/FecR protein